MQAGFLITGLLLAESRAHGRISLRRFWIRRARGCDRLLVVLAAVAVAERVLATPEAMRLVRGDLLAIWPLLAVWALTRHRSPRVRRLAT